MKQEEPEVPNKDPKGFQTLKLSAQSSSCVAPEAQKPAIVTGPLTPKAKQMPVRRGDVPPGTSIPTQPAYTTGRPIAMRRLSFGVTVHSKLRHDCKSAISRSGSRARKSWT